MDAIVLPHRGWGKGTVPVDRPAQGAACVMEIQGNLLGFYYVHGLIDTPDRLERGEMLCTVSFTKQRVRAVVPPRYTHLKIEKPRSSAGIVWWKFGYRAGDTCPELRDAVHGKHPDVLRYLGPATTATLEVGNGHARLYQYSMDGTGSREIEFVSQGPFRGPVKLPAGPVLLQMDCLVGWSLTLRA